MVCEGIIYEPIYDYKKTQMGWAAKVRVFNLKNVFIPEHLDNMPVLEIGPYLFANDDVEFVSIPSSVLTIGFGAFKDCKHLQKIKIYPSEKGDKSDILKLYGNVFKNCTTLVSIEGEKTFQLLGNGVFGNCMKLVLTEDTPILGDVPTASFYMCHMLRSLSFVGENIVFSPTAFYGCRNLRKIFLDCENVEFGNKCFSAIKDKQFICTNDCNFVDLACLGLNVIVKEE